MLPQLALATFTWIFLAHSAVRAAGPARDPDAGHHPRVVYRESGLQRGASGRGGIPYDPGRLCPVPSWVGGRSRQGFCAGETAHFDRVVITDPHKPGAGWVYYVPKAHSRRTRHEAERARIDVQAEPDLPVAVERGAARLRREVEENLPAPVQRPPTYDESREILARARDARRRSRRAQYED